MIHDPLTKKILFLSGVDFKEKSIQVIRKTPEAYQQAGWEVHYVVGRDSSRLGDYFYERVIDPPGLHIHRFSVPLSGLHGLIDNVIWKAFWFRVRNLLLVLQLVIKGTRLLQRNRFDVLYGYEIPGVLAGRIIKGLGYAKVCKFVTRFQGVLYVKEWLRTGQKLRFISNFEAITALRTPADLCIMTNDGSQGVEVLKKLHSPVNNILFVSNGVDVFEFDERVVAEVKDKYYKEGLIYFLSVSRLDNHKRLDRGIRVIYHLIHTQGCKNLCYTIIGGGAESEKLKSLVEDLGLSQYVRFLGPINHDRVKYHYYFSDYFLSMYTSTNVGNPLLEAIRSNNIIITLDNGDTGEWIQHYQNGLIYPVNDDKDLNDDDYQHIARDISQAEADHSVRTSLKERLAKTASDKLWTWEQRFETEVKAVETIIDRK